MADDVKYGRVSGAGGVPLNTEARTTTSTEAGHTTAQIQHVKLDTGDGTNVQPVSGTLAVTGSVTATGTVTANLGATDNAVLDDIALNQTDASQKTQLVDGSGNVIGSTSNKLNVNASGTVTANLSETDNSVLDDIAANQTDNTQTTQIVGQAQFGTGTAQFYDMGEGGPYALRMWLDGIAAEAQLSVDGTVAITASGGETLAVNGSNLLTAASPYDSQIGKYAKIDPMRQLATVQPVRLVGTDFGGTTKDTNFWTESAGGGAGGGVNGSVAQAGQIVLTSGTKTDAYAQYKSVRTARYVAGSANFFRSVVRLPDAGSADNIRRWGAFTTDANRVPQNGAWFQLNGTTMGVAYVSNGGTPTVVTSTDIALTKDTSAHTYEIVWTNSKIWYYQDDVLKHTVTASSAVWSYMGAFNATLHNINSGNTTSVDLNCRVASIYRFGHIDTVATYKNITGAGATVCKYGAGMLKHITFNNPAAKAAIIYDNTAGSGTIIGTVTPVATSSPFTLDYECPFNTGLTIDTSAGAQDITVVYE